VVAVLVSSIGYPGADAVQWVFATTNIIHIRALNYFIDIQKHLDKIRDMPRTFDQRTLHYTAQCCLALGLLYYMHQYAGDPTILGKPALGCTKMIMTHLRTTLSIVLPSLITQDLDVNSEPFRGYSNIHLWGLFLGAQAERANSKLFHNPSKSWFSTMFWALAGKLGLCSWLEVKERVSHYIEND
jgi:hypothetical protein